MRKKYIKIIFFVYIFISIIAILIIILFLPYRPIYPSWNKLNKNNVHLDACKSSYCVLIDFKLKYIEEEYAVGDKFSYEFKLKNVGNGTILYNFIVTSEPKDLLSPEPEKKYKVILKEGESKNFFPQISKDRPQGYFFDKEGSYNIYITPEKYTHFIKYPSLDAGHNLIRYTFDVVSKWEKKWAYKLQRSNNMMIAFTAINSLIAFFMLLITIRIYKKPPRVTPVIRVG